ncbi:YqeB family protein [Nocardioides alcanivorans]|uniref:YqeB family protein n=1 Tax=Nocardioides alcanivorans TaxID=2897352 RepID=UPI001F1C8C32|nr:hypothetical protein [Nocardioides alcanivorans]
MSESERTASDDSEQRTVGGFDGPGRVLVCGLFAAVGAVLGAVVPLLARWASDLPWAPFSGPLELLGSFDQAWLVWGRPALVALVGLGFAGWVIAASPVLQVSSTEIQVQRHGRVERVIPREKVDSIHRRGAKTVIESTQGRELFADEVEGGIGPVRAAFVETGWPWEGPGTEATRRAAQPRRAEHQSATGANANETSPPISASAAKLVRPMMTPDSAAPAAPASAIRTSTLPCVLARVDRESHR